MSQFEAVLTEAQIATHFEAGEKVDRVLAAGWQEMGRLVREHGNTSEYAIVEFLQKGMRHEGLVWDHGTNVSCGPNSADSHYHPSAEQSLTIKNGDFVLIDIWGAARPAQLLLLRHHLDGPWSVGSQRNASRRSSRRSAMRAMRPALWSKQSLRWPVRSPAGRRTTPHAT